MEDKYEKMLAIALDTRANAHAPYSHFKVGACIETGDGILFSGCNVENASYSQTQCAEATAIGTMIANGHTSIASILITADSNGPCFPCGACRQRISEFASPHTVVLIANLDKIVSKHTFKELFPFQFSDSQLEKPS